MKRTLQRMCAKAEGAVRDHPLLAGYFGIVLVLWAALWLGEIRESLRGANTAPLYLRITLAEGNDAEITDLLRISARSAATGSESLPEKIEGEAGVLRWSWVLLDSVSLSMVPGSEPGSIRTIEYAFDPQCRNEELGIPMDLIWAPLRPRGERGAGVAEWSNPPRFRGSILPLRSPSRALNWGGDLRLLAQAFPKTPFPYALFLFFTLCLAFAAGMKQALRPSSTTNSDFCLKRFPPLHRVLLAGGLTACFIYFAVTGHPVFNANDDFGITVLLAGWLQTPAGIRGCWINSLLGSLVYGLFAVAPNAPWYAIVLFLSLLSGLILVVLCLVVVARSARILFASLLLFLFFAYPVFTRTSFTIAAEFVTLSGAVGFATAFGLAGAIPGMSRRIKHCVYGLAVASGALIVHGSLFRFHASLLVLVLCGAIAAFWVVSTRNWNLLLANGRRVPLVVGVVSVGLCVLLHFVDRAVVYGKDSGWSKFHETNRLRATIIDLNAGVFSRMIEEDRLQYPPGWSRADAAVFAQFYHNEPHLLDPELLAPIAYQVSKEARKHRSGFLESADVSLRRMTAPDEARLILFGLCLVVLSVCLLVRARERPVAVFAGCAPIATLLLLEVATKFTPYRVSYGVLFTGLVFLVFLVAVSDIRIQRRIPAMFSIGLLSAAIVLAASTHIAETDARRVRSEEFRSAFPQLVRTIDSPFLLLHMPTDAHPLFFFQERLYDWPAIPIGAFPYTPPGKEAGRKLGHRGLVSLLDADETALMLMASSQELDPTDHAKRIESFRLYAERQLQKPVDVEVKNEIGFWIPVEFRLLP